MTTRTMLITGGSRGIGRATAIMAAQQGWNVGLSYRSDAQAAEEVVRAIHDAGGKGLAVQADAAQEAEVIGFFDACEAAFGRPDAVVINAGIVGPKATLAEMDIDRLRLLIDTNVLGAMLTARDAARRMPRGMDEPSASLVIISSAAARLGSPGEYVDYAATKGAMDTLTRGLSLELASQNIRVNAVRPGIIDTDIHASGGQPDRVDRVAPLVPVKRAGTADEVASAILWLCSDGASYTTGAHLDVSGGR